MTENYLEKLFEHNNWANLQIIEACARLTDAQLDAPPQSATEGSIRNTLIHLVSAQNNYLRTLTLPIDERRNRVDVEFSQLEQSLKTSAEGLLALAKDIATISQSRLITRDGHYAEPWVLMVQVINHATEHREQIKSMLTALGVEPPSIDGWDYGTVTNALVPISK